jgi:hypothetical protein
VLGNERHAVNDSELLEYSREHLLYEVMRFISTAQILTSYDFSRFQPEELRLVFHDAIVESFAIHTRNLIDFFYPGPGRKQDDVLANHYFENQVRPSSFPQISSVLGDARERAHKEISHLTARRKSGKSADKDWPIAGLESEIRQLLLTFAREAAPTKLTPDLGQLLRTTPLAVRVVPGPIDASTSSGPTSTVVVRL